MWPFKPKVKATPAKGKYWSETMKRVEPVNGQHFSGYKISAWILTNRKGQEESIETIHHFFRELDQHDDAIAELSRKCYERIQQEYKKEIIVQKLYEIDPINNKLEMFAKTNLGSVYAQKR